MENITFDNGDMAVLWQMNLFPDYPMFALNRNVKFIKDADIDNVMSEMSSKTLVVFCFYTLGYKHINIAGELGVSEEASQKRIKKHKEQIKKKFGGFDIFRSRCIYSGAIFNIIRIVDEFIGVNRL